MLLLSPTFDRPERGAEPKIRREIGRPSLNLARATKIGAIKDELCPKPLRGFGRSEDARRSARAKFGSVAISQDFGCSDQGRSKVGERSSVRGPNLGLRPRQFEIVRRGGNFCVRTVLLRRETRPGLTVEKTERPIEVFTCGGSKGQNRPSQKGHFWGHFWPKSTNADQFAQKPSPLAHFGPLDRAKSPADRATCSSFGPKPPAVLTPK